VAINYKLLLPHVTDVSSPQHCFQHTTASTPRVVLQCTGQQKVKLY